MFQETITLTFNKRTQEKRESRKQITELITTRNKIEKFKVFSLSPGLKRFARLGLLGNSSVTLDNVTDCDTKNAIPWLSVVGGILYVSHPHQVQSSVSVCVSDQVVRLSVEDGADCSSDVWCSQLETKEECLSSCHSVTGSHTVLVILLPPASIGQACSWVPGITSRAMANKNKYTYSTCTTSPHRCADGVCDDLERMEYSLCPQDCVTKGDDNSR